MSFQSGSYAASSTGASQLITGLETALAAHPSWSFIETFTSGTNTYRVWKCTGSGANANDWGSDFYVVFARTTSGVQSNLTVYAGEGYNATTHQLIRPVAGRNTAVSATPNANYSYGDETNGVAWTDTVALAGVFPSSGNSVTVNWSAIVTKNGIWLKNDANTTAHFYVGLFDSKLDGVSPHLTEPFPLMMWSSSLSAFQASNPAGVSRHPGVSAPSTLFGGHAIFPYSTGYGHQSATDLFQGETSAPRAALMGNSIPSNHGAAGGLRGLVKDARMTGVGATPGITDTIVIDGQIYWYFNLANNFGTYAVWAKRDAA